MSVSIEWPTSDTPLTADGDRLTVTVTVTGVGPRRAAVFVNEAVSETDDLGRFTCDVELEPGDGWLVAGLLRGCACVTQRLPVHVGRGAAPGPPS